jgi:hypothetical protein
MSLAEKIKTDENGELHNDIICSRLHNIKGASAQNQLLICACGGCANEKIEKCYCRHLPKQVAHICFQSKERVNYY